MDSAAAGAAGRRLRAVQGHLVGSEAPSSSSCAAPAPPARLSRAEATAARVTDALAAHGYCVVENYLDAPAVQRIRAEMEPVLASIPPGRNKFEGFGTKRVYALFAKVRGFDPLAIDPLVLEVVEKVLKSKHFQLSSPTGILIGPGEKAQMLHRDEGKYPIPRPHPEVIVNTMWALDDFTEHNGATVIIPGSHTRGVAGGQQRAADAREGRGQSVVLGKAWASHDSDKADAVREDAVPATMPKGSVMFYLGSLLHGGGANRTSSPRLGVILEYAAAWLRPQETHLLAVPREIVRTLPRRLQELLGYDVAPPFLGYVDGRHPRRLLE